MINDAKIINGNYIKVYRLNDFFDHVVCMLLEHFDNKKYEKTLFAVGTYCFEPIQNIKNVFPDYKVIIYQLEQMMDGDNWHYSRKSIGNMEGADEIWDYDFINSEYLKHNNVKVNKILNLVYTDSLKKIQHNENPFFDVLFYGFMNERRYRILHKIQSDLYGKIKINWIYGCQEIDKYLENTKVVLNLHAFEPYNRQEQVRMFYPVINGKAVVSEISQMNNMDGCIIETSIDNISHVLMGVCKTNLWKDFGMQASKNFKELSAKKLLEI
jgi:hypothetical protein